MDEKEAKIDDKLAAIHHEYIRAEWEISAANRNRRTIACNYYDGKTPPDDKFSKMPWLAGVRVNNLKTPIDMMTAELSKRMLYPKIFALGGDSGKAYKEAQIRDLQVRSIITSSYLHDHRPTAIESALKSGDGWMTFGYRRNKYGAVKIFSNYGRWENILFDSQHSNLNGDIDPCRFLTSFSLVDVDHFSYHFPKYKDQGKAASEPQEGWRQAALDGLYGSDFTANLGFSNGFTGGGNSNRKFVVYGVFFYRDYREGGIIKKYPFLSDRGLSTFTQLAPAERPYKHNHYPFLRWVSNIRNSDGQPYSANEHKIGLERVMQYALRMMVNLMNSKSYVFTQDAIPTAGHGEKQMTIDEFADYVRIVAGDTLPIWILGKNGLAHFKEMSNENQVKNLAETIKVLQGFQNASGDSVDSVLTSGGGVNTSGTALRERKDNASAGHRMLFDSDRRAMRTAGEIALSMIEEFAHRDDFPMNSYTDEDGSSRQVNDIKNGGFPQSEISLTSITSKDLGVFVTVAERKPDVVSELLPMAVEAIKAFAGNHQMVGLVFLTIMKHANYNSMFVAALGDELTRQGVNLPPDLLSPQGRELKMEMEQQNKAKGEEQAAKETAMFNAQLEKLQAATDKDEATAAKTASEIADGPISEELKAKAIQPAGGEAGQLMIELDKVQKENAGLKKLLEQLQAQFGGGGGGMPPPV